MPPPGFRLYAIGAGCPKPRAGTSFSANGHSMDGESRTGSRQRPRRVHSLVRCHGTGHRRSRSKSSRLNHTGQRVQNHRLRLVVTARDSQKIRHGHSFVWQLSFASPLCVIFDCRIRWRQERVKTFFHDRVTFAGGLFQTGAVKYDNLASVVTN